MSRRDRERMVYSSEHGRVCPRCERPQASCACKQRPTSQSPVGPVRVRLEKKGRRGKTVTTIHGLALASDALASLGADLKRRCGTGGAVKDGVIEIQGDHAALVVDWLNERGHRAKRAGG